MAPAPDRNGGHLRNATSFARNPTLPVCSGRRQRDSGFPGIFACWEHLGWEHLDCEAGTCCGPAKNPRPKTVEPRLPRSSLCRERTDVEVAAANRGIAPGS